VIDMGTYGSAADWTMQIGTSASGLKAGCLSLLSHDRMITVTNAWPVYPIEQAFDAHIGRQITVTGQPIEQRRGGATRLIGIEIPYVKLAATDSGQEGWLDDYWMDEAYGVQGFLGAVWLVNDNGNAFHGHIQRPIGAPITHVGGRSRISLTLKTIPHIGLM
jgi:hypothetical protein